jgi:putative hydrolase of the HAD superfamily
MSERLALLIDADDTLWENSVYFEEAIDEFVAFLDHSELSHGEVRQVLDEIELKNVGRRGYGSLSFGQNLWQCFQHLSQRGHSDDDLDRCHAMAVRILERPVELIEGVAETVEYLTERHELTLFTKGHSDEQLLKFQRSNLGPRFHGCRVVPEKNVAAYRAFVDGQGLAPERTWMIGNSPKSDIHPALECGLGAVLAPHERTWSLELSDVPAPSERFHIVERFSDLKRLF